MAKRFAIYRVFFRFFDGEKVRRRHVTLDASSKEDAKKRVIRGEKPKAVAVDRVVRV